jgi:hypothetical protein
MHTHIICAEIHSIFLQNGGVMFDSPANRVTRRDQVASIYIRHYRGILSYECRLALSPSIMSLKPSQNRSLAVLAVAEVPVYVAFAACSKFKLYFNGKLVAEADSVGYVLFGIKVWKLYGAYVSVSPGGVFSFSTESCGDFKGFVGCFGSSVCTGYNDGNGWFCARAQPPDGWMLPSYRHDDIDQLSQQFKLLKPSCNINNESDIWSFYTRDMMDYQCLGLSAFPAAFDAVSCSRACCADSACSRFQWCSGGDCNSASLNGVKCWIGGSTDCQNRQVGWFSGIQTLPHTAQWTPAVSQGKISQPSRDVEPGLDNNALWLWPSNSQEEQMHCRWSL